MLMLTVACGNANEEEVSTNSKEETKSAGTQENKKDSGESKKEETTEEPSSSSDIMNPNIAEASDGDVEEIFTNEDPGYVHDMDGFIVSVNEYQIVKVTDMQAGMYEFDDKTEGYVITTEVTINNTRNKAIYYPIVLNIQLSNKFDYLHGGRTFVRDEYPVSETEEESTKFGAGEKVTGLVSFVLTTEEYEKIKEVKPKFVIEGRASENKDFSGAYSGNAIFDFAYSTEQKKEAKAESNKFYQDDLMTENIAEKKMLYEKEGINETKQLEDLSVTLNGLQYTEVIPTAESESKFSNFKDGGVVALTVKLTLENTSKDPIDIWSFGSKVKIDDDRGNAFTAASLEPESVPMEIEAGETKEKLHVFLFRKDEFETMKTFDLEFGDLMAKEEQLFKRKTINFSLPR